MNEIKLIALCSSRFALPSLQQLAFFKQLAVVVIPSHCEEMIENTKLVLAGTDVVVLTVNKAELESKIIDVIKKYAINTGLMMTFSFKIPAAVYQLPEKGFFNVHPGALPAFRGPDPVFQQIKNKEKFAGVTIHKIDDDFDTGPVVLNEMIKLDPADTWGILNEKLSYTAAKLTGTLLKLLSFEVAIPSKPQDESKAKYYKKQVSADVSINWQEMDALSIIALINACNPWNKGAVTRLNTKIIRLLETYVMDTNTLEQIPGTILSIDDRGMIIAAKDNMNVCVQVVYIDEGFLQAKRLIQFGVMPGAVLSIV